MTHLELEGLDRNGDISGLTSLTSLKTLNVYRALGLGQNASALSRLEALSLTIYSDELSKDNILNFEKIPSLDLFPNLPSKGLLIVLNLLNLETLVFEYIPIRGERSKDFSNLKKLKKIDIWMPKGSRFCYDLFVGLPNSEELRLINSYQDQPKLPLKLIELKNLKTFLLHFEFNWRSTEERHRNNSELKELSTLKNLEDLTLIFRGGLNIAEEEGRFISSLDQLKKLKFNPVGLGLLPQGHLGRLLKNLLSLSYLSLTFNSDKITLEDPILLGSCPKLRFLNILNPEIIDKSHPLVQRGKSVINNSLHKNVFFEGDQITDFGSVRLLFDQEIDYNESEAEWASDEESASSEETEEENDLAGKN